MAKITTYSTLQDAIADHINRSDLTAVIPTLIQLAEDFLKDDHRVRAETVRGTWEITADGDALPDDFGEVQEWTHDGPVYYGAIEVVENLGTVKAAYGLTSSGVPRYAAIRNGRVYYAPAPDATYTTAMSYHRKLVELSDSNTTNWLLTAHPRIYLYASLVEAEAYLKDDPRVDLWRRGLEDQLDKLRQRQLRGNFAGGTVQRFRHPIG